MIDFFAGFGPERERRMALCVVEVERRRLAGDKADQALMRAQHGAVHGVAIKALGGVEFERIVDPQDVDRAHLRHHVGGDQHHDLVQTFLGGDLLRHGFAKPSQQDAGTSRRASHHFKSSPTRPAYRAPPNWRSTQNVTILFIRRCRKFETDRITPPKQWHSSQSGSSSGRIPNRALFCQAKALPVSRFRSSHHFAECDGSKIRTQALIRPHQDMLQPLRENCF